MTDFIYNFVPLSKKVLFLGLFAYFLSQIGSAVRKLDEKELVSHSFYFFTETRNTYICFAWLVYEITWVNVTYITLIENWHHNFKAKLKHHAIPIIDILSTALAYKCHIKQHFNTYT